jgi:hypothetical protein
VIPRTCDDDRCDYDDSGWQHVCAATATPWGPEDMAAATAMEDGYAPSTRIPAQTPRRAAA